MRGSPLKLNIKFGWRVGCGTEEPRQQVEAFEEKLIFLSLLVIFHKWLLAWGMMAPQPRGLNRQGLSIQRG